MRCKVCDGTGRYTSIDGVDDVCYKCSGIGTTSKVNELVKINKLLQKQLDQLIQNEEHRILLHSIGQTSPIMMWAKDVNGVYTYANKALADHLFYGKPEDLIGKDDMQIDKVVKELWPKWDFGTICNASDHMVLMEEKPMRFNEWGIIRDKFQYVVAFKAPYYDKRNKLLGTTGLAYYVTDEINELKLILENTTDENTKEQLQKYLSRYGFGNENKYTIDNYTDKVYQQGKGD